MLLHTNYINKCCNKYFDLIKKYEKEGIIKKFDNYCYGTTFEDFEWIQEKI